MKKLMLFWCLFLTAAVFAQTQGNTAVNAQLPKITVSLGGYKAGNITTEILSKIVDSSLVARDPKGTSYPIVRFRILYRFKSSYEDPETGQKKTVDDLRTNDFTNTSQLTELWRQSIKDNVTKGDEITLDNIIVKLKNGTKLMAPALTFNVVQ